MCSQQSKGAKYPQKSFNCADAFSIKITRFHAALKPIFRSLKPFQAFSSLLNLGARDFSFYMNTHSRILSAFRWKIRRTVCIQSWMDTRSYREAVKIAPRRVNEFLSGVLREHRREQSVTRQSRAQQRSRDWEIQL